MKVSKGTITRTVVLIIALANQLLAAFGKSPLPIDGETATQIISTGFTVVTALIAWWKNNSFSAAALKGDAVMKDEKAKK